MKIVFKGGKDIRKLGGIENYMYNLATVLVKKNYEPVVFCESDRNEVEYINGFKVIHRKSFGSRYIRKIILSYMASIYALLHERDAVIYHYNAWPPSLASWMPGIFGKIAIYQGHGFGWKRTKYNALQQMIMKFMEYIVVKSMNNLTVVSKEQSDYFLHNYGRKSITIPTAVNLPVEKIISDILKKLNLTSDGYFLYLGRLVQDKNPDYLIKAFIKCNISQKKLVVAGSNESDLKYVNYLHQLGKSNSNIIFTGPVYGSDKEMLLDNCFAFCIPSTIEGLPITLLEAMSHKRFCIASDIPSNKEALGENGIYVKHEDVDDLSEKLMYLFNNHENLEPLKEINYQNIVNRFTWDKISNRYIQYLKTLIHEQSV